MPDSSTAERSPWPHRWAVLLCVTTFPLLWVGQLITTTDAGMAVPDWPGTYGYNMFAYPWQTWMFGPWDLMVEHGHRLFASLVGLLTIALLIVVWRKDDRRLVRVLSAAALGLVIFQGVLGGLRVVANERLLAMAHGCTGPAFFALTCLLVVLTARGAKPTAAGEPSVNGVARMAAFTAALAYLQLALGASLRHVDAATGPWAFATLVKFHLLMAAVVAGYTLAVGHKAFYNRAAPRSARRLGLLVALVVVGQLTLGVGTWLAKYGAPRWASDWLPATMGPNLAGGWSQTHTVTAHSATGSLLLGLLVALTATLWRHGASASAFDSSRTYRSQPVQQKPLPTQA